MINISIEEKQKKSYNIYTWIVAPLCLILSLYCLLNSQHENYTYFALLPMIHALFIWVFFHFNNRNGLAFNTINIVMFLRYCVSIVLTLTTPHYDGLSLRANNFSEVFILMAYEMLVVYLVMFIYNARNSSVEYEPLDYTHRKGSIFRTAFFVIFIIVMIYAILFYPSARNVMFNFTFSSARDKAISSDATITGPAFVFFKIGLNVTYGLIMTAIIRRIKKRTVMHLLLCFAISAVFVSCNWTSGGGVSRWGLVTSVLVSLIVLAKSFPEYRRPIFVVSAIALGVIILSSSITKVILHHASDTQDALDDIFSAAYFNEYFQGFIPVSNSLSVVEAAKDRINFITFLDDVCSAYPWVNKLFYEPGNLTETIYLTAINMNDKIIPTITQGYAHFGPVLAPLFSGLLTYIALKCDDVMRKTNDIFVAIPVSQIAVWASMFMAVNVYIIQRTTMYFVLLLLVIWFDKKFRL